MFRTALLTLALVAAFAGTAQADSSTQVNVNGDNDTVEVTNIQIVLPTVQPLAQDVLYYCATQVGQYGPGPATPAGSPCSATTPWGVALGVVVTH